MSMSLRLQCIFSMPEMCSVKQINQNKISVFTFPLLNTLCCAVDNPHSSVVERVVFGSSASYIPGMEFPVFNCGMLVSLKTLVFQNLKLNSSCIVLRDHYFFVFLNFVPMSQPECNAVQFLWSCSWQLFSCDETYLMFLLLGISLLQYCNMHILAESCSLQSYLPLIFCPDTMANNKQQF